MTGKQPSTAARIAGPAVVVCIFGAFFWFVTGKFTLDFFLVILGGAAGIFITFGWLFEAADGRSSWPKIGALWVFMLVLWFIVRWLLDTHPWRG